jgi:hypothetical protein
MLHSMNSNMEHLHKKLEYVEYPFKCCTKHLELALNSTFFLEKIFGVVPVWLVKLGAK